MKKDFDVVKTPPPITILAATLTMHERTGWVCKHLADWTSSFLYSNLMKVLHGQPLEYSLMMAYCHNFMPAAAARNRFGREVVGVEPKPDWVLMIDNDMAPPDNLLDTIKDAPADASIVVPRFSMWDESKAAISLCWGMENPQVFHDEDRQFFSLDGPGFYPLTKCGTGAIFIKPDVFSRISMPYFWYPRNEDQGNEGTEDIAFCGKVIEAGMKIYGNAGVVVGHYHNCDLERVAHALHLAGKQAVEIYKKGLDNQLTGSNLVSEGQERPSTAPSAAAARPA